MWSRVGTQQSVEIFNGGTNEIEENIATVSGSNYAFTIPSGSQHINLTSGQDRIELILIGKESPQMSASCSFINEAFNDLGKVAISSEIVTCDVVGDPATNTKLSFIVTTDRGDILPLLDKTFTVLVNQTIYANLSVDNWDPSPGSFSIIVTAYDEYGNVLSSISKNVVARESGWNIGISSISAKGDINVAISRTNYPVLENAVCILTVTSQQSDFKAEVLIDVAGSQFSPNIRIDADDLDENEQLEAVLGCNSPFDVDDDLSDNSATILYEEKEASALTSSNMLWGAIVAIVSIGIYLFIIQRQDNALIRDMMKEQQARAKPQKKAVPEQAKPKSQESEIENISIEQEQTEPEDIPTMIEEIPIEDDLTPSGRLDSIRKEINPDAEESEESSIEDRMSRFFQ